MARQAAADKDEDSSEEEDSDEEDSDEEMPAAAQPASSKRKAAEVKHSSFKHPSCHHEEVHGYGWRQMRFVGHEVCKHVNTVVERPGPLIGFFRALCISQDHLGRLSEALTCFAKVSCIFSLCSVPRLHAW